MLIHAQVEGKVQGVFFRKTVKEHAQQKGIKGYVRNLEDGSVEIVAQAKPQEVEDFFVAIEQSPGSAVITKIHQKQIKEEKQYDGFEIRY